MAEKETPSRFSDFIKNIESNLIKLTTLEIRTVVGEYRLEADDTIQPVAGGDFKVLQSKINLIAGDISTYISNDLVNDKYEWLRNFHAAKEQNGHEIINGNIRAIMSIIELYRNAKNAGDLEAHS